MIREAIDRDPVLGQVGRRVFSQGSYANGTNVRLDSDVDIAVQYTDGKYTDVGNQDDQIAKAARQRLPSYTGPFPTFRSYKDAVEKALVNRFGRDEVTRRPKCIEVAPSTARLPADVVPCWTYEWFYSSWGQARSHVGICLFRDGNNQRTVNYPDQHKKNGNAKNDVTQRRYKKMVRMLKRLENKMVDEGVIRPVPSFLTECLVYVTPNSAFTRHSWEARLREVLFQVWDQTKGPEPTSEEDRLLEVNDIKFLFHPAQKWSRNQAANFAHTAWNHLGFG